MPRWFGFALFVFAFLGLFVVEILRWLADMPSDVATSLTALCWLAIGGQEVLERRGKRELGEDEIDE